MYRYIISILIFIIIIISVTFLYYLYYPHRVLDCSNANVCESRNLEYAIVSCEPWTLNCKKSKRNLRLINYIADESNYIPGKFTKHKYKVTNLDYVLKEPWAIKFLPDNSILITERNGRLIYIKNNNINVAYQFNPIYISETGLLGLAIDPDYSKNKYIYIYYTYTLDNDYDNDINLKEPYEIRVLNRVSRFVFDNGNLEHEQVLIDKIPGSGSHSGGRLEFGPDRKLYATTGDAGESEKAQIETFLSGKILRINKDGSIPDDNPFVNSYVYTAGHRNPQGLAWHPETKQLYASEHGPWRYDEINLIETGNNYGWGTFKCDDNNYNIPIYMSPVIFPIICAKSWTMAPSGMEFISDPKSPWYGSMFVASLRGKHVRRYEIDKGKVQTDEIFFVNDKGLKISKRIRDLEYHDGSLYVIGDEYGVVKITPR